MKKSILPEISQEIQQSTFGAFSGSNSDTYDGGWLDPVYIGGGGGDSGGGSDGGGYDPGYGGYDPGYGSNGGYDGGGYNGGGGSSSGDGVDTGNSISSSIAIDVIEGDASFQEMQEFDDKVTSAITNIAAGHQFMSSVYTNLSSVMESVGFNQLGSVKQIDVLGKKVGVVGVAIGGAEAFVAVSDHVNGVDEWDSVDTLNALSTALGVATLVPGPHQVVTGGLSLAFGLIGSAMESNQDVGQSYDYDYYY